MRKKFVVTSEPVTVASEGDAPGRGSESDREPPSDRERQVDLEADQARAHAVVVAAVAELAGQRVDEGVQVPAVPEERHLARDVEELARGVVGRVEAEERVRARRDVGGLMLLALVALAGIDGREPAVLVGAPGLGLLRGRWRWRRGRVGGRGCLLVRDAEVAHDDEQLHDGLPRVVALFGQTLVGHRVRRVGEVLAAAPVDRDPVLDDVRLVAVVVPLVERGVGDARDLLGGESRQARQGLPDAELLDRFGRRKALRVRSREGVADGVHQLVEAVAALARPGPAVEDDLAHEVVEKIAAPDQRRGREAARNRGSLDVGGFGVLELRHEVKALAGVAELPPEGRVGLVGQGLRPVEQGVGRRRVGTEAGRMPVPAETERRSELAVVEEIAQDVGPRRMAVVALDERAVGEGLDDDVALAVERRGGPAEERCGQREARRPHASGRRDRNRLIRAFCRNAARRVYARAPNPGAPFFSKEWAELGFQLGPASPESRSGRGGTTRMRLGGSMSIVSATRIRVLGAGLVVLLLGAAAPASGQAKAAKEKHALPTEIGGKGGDFDAMKKRRQIRVLVVFNKTNFFIDKGAPRGITYEAFKMFEDELNKKYKTGNLKVHVSFYPVSRNDLAAALLDGRGDVAAANLTVTPERLEKFDFTNPTAKNVSEIVVASPKAEAIATVDDLSGKEVFVRKGSIYNESLDKLNADLAKRGKKPVKLRFAPENLEDEDLLEMANAGLVQYVVVDDFLARFWAQVLPDLKIYPQVAGPLGRPDRVGGPQGQPAPEGRAQRIPRPAPRGVGRVQHAVPEVPQEHEVREERDGGCGAAQAAADRRVFQKILRAVRHGLPADGGAGLPGIPAPIRTRRARSAPSASCR